ncbi:DUF952 domain-containing protein [Chelativorans composti]|jgi:Uncharacterized protein conserved in bacteria|uniref:DUF952 domain-containing protein n=1 Tax=Chelativorans composti TaxID=768533 RepID=A0ABW5DJL4_9HYPH
MAKLIYKICPATMWQAAAEEGVFRGAPVDLADGFIHFSTASQVRETAAKHFAGQSGLVLIAVDEGRLGPELKYEVSRGGQLFPHLYAPLPCDAVAWVEPLPLCPDGQHQFPDLPE